MRSQAGGAGVGGEGRESDWWGAGRAKGCQVPVSRWRWRCPEGVRCVTLRLATALSSRVSACAWYANAFPFERHQPEGARDCSPVTRPLGSPQDTVLAWDVSEMLLWEQSSPGKVTSSLKGQARQRYREKGGRGEGEGRCTYKWTTGTVTQVTVGWLLMLGHGLRRRKEGGRGGRKEEGREEGTETFGRSCPTPGRSQALHAVGAGLTGLAATPGMQVLTSHPSHRQGGKGGVPSRLSQPPPLFP